MFAKSLLTSLVAIFATGALAEKANFESLDADGSGGLSLTEVQAAAPAVTADEFSAYDEDASGELSVDEFSTWMASQSDEAAPQ